MRYNSFLLLTILFCFNTKAQNPNYYWTFDTKDSLIDIINKQKLNIESYKAKIQKIKTPSGYGVKPESSTHLVVTDFLVKTSNLEDFSIEFAFNGRNFLFTTFPKNDFRLNFSSQGIYVIYSVLRNNKVYTERWDISLNGTGITSYYNLANNEWHHFVFVGRKSGDFEIWIDGQSDVLLTKKTSAFDKWVVSGRDGLKMDASIDELAFYTTAIKPELIRQHFYELQIGEHYSSEINSALLSNFIKTSKLSYAIDTMEFAPGYPEYTVQATDQLKRFPEPRFRHGVDISRNFPWMDITYLHRELPGAGGKEFGKVNPKTAERLTDELVNTWNYYIELPTLRMDSVEAKKRYTNPSEIFSTLIAYANAHPQIPVATILMQVQNKPSHAGFDRASPYVTAKNLPDEYYLRDKKKSPIQYNNKKWLSPFTSERLVQKDGLTSAYYINQLAKHLTRKIDMINENGEWFGHKWPQQVLQQSPEVTKFLKITGLDYERFNGWMQNWFDSVYKTTIVNNIPWKNVAFTFYNVSAYNSNYWPEFSERINTNSLLNGTPRSTPSFYPARPDNWRLATGSLNGYGTVAEGRKKEINLGVKYFAPFVCAGWNLEEKNIRPAQWLGLLKAMVMLGADFFHVGYFNVTGKTGWPNGNGPNDPRGYIYQAATPSYAQAIASHAWDFFEKGTLLEDPLSKDGTLSFAFSASSPNHLVLVRKVGKKFLIYGSIQPSSNYKGNAALEARTTINLEGKEISFTIRRQGSMYVLDMSDLSNPIFRQLDSWHQYEHPFYWSNNIAIEGENADLISNAKTLSVRHNTASYDFVRTSTYVEIKTTSTAKFKIPLKRNQPLALSLIIKNEGVNAICLLKTSKGSITKTVPDKGDFIITLDSSDLKNLHLRSGDLLTISAVKGSFLLDKILF